MGNNINEKNPSEQIKIFMKRIREGNYDSRKNEDNNQSKNLSMRDMLKITRRLNENDDNMVNKETVFDQKNEEKKMIDYFDNKVNIRFIDLEVYNDLVFWGGTVDGIIQFVYTVTPDDETSGVKFNYLEDFTPDNPKNDEILKKLEDYYNIFAEYWRNNIIQK